MQWKNASVHLKGFQVAFRLRQRTYCYSVMSNFAASLSGTRTHRSFPQVHVLWLPEDQPVCAISLSRKWGSNKLNTFSNVIRFYKRPDSRTSTLARIKNWELSLDALVKRNCQLTFGRHYGLLIPKVTGAATFRTTVTCNTCYNHDSACVTCAMF